MIIFDLFEDNNEKSQGVTLAEFAPSDSDNGDDGFSKETLKQLAAQWYNGDEDPEVERTLEVAGWEIGQVEDDDEPGVFVVLAGDINGNSYIQWTEDELRQGVAEGYTDDDIETIRQFRNAITGVKARSAINKAKDGPGAKYYYDGAKVTPQETARRAAERKAKKDKEGVAEGVDLINMTDLQFYKELLAVLLIPVTALGVSAWNKVMNSLRLYRAEEIVQALQKKGITVDRDTFDQIKPLLQQLEQAIDVNNDGDAAKELAQRIQQTVSWGKLKQPTANSQSPATARNQQGVTEAEGPGRVDPILYKALARMTKGGYDDAKIALAIEFGLLDMKHNYAIANNYIPKLVDLYNQKHGVAEARKKKKKKSSKSLGRYFFPGYGYYGGGESGEGGGDGGGGESVNRGTTESLEDYERYQYIVTLKSGKRIRFLCGADCDVKTYIERKYKEPVVDIKDQGIVGEPPVELLPGEMKEAIKTIKGPHGRQEVDTDTPGVTRVRQTSRLGAKTFGLPSRPATATAGEKTPVGKNASSLTNPVSSARRINPRLDRDDSGQLASYSSEDTIKELAPNQKQPSDQEGKIAAELRKLRAQYPDARSDIEAVAIGGQEAHADARQNLARVDAIVSKLDRAADQLQSANVDQDSELNTLDRENNDLEQMVKELEKRIGQLKEPRSKSADQPTQARSTEPQKEPAAQASPTAKAEPAKAKDKPKTDLDTDVPLTPEYRAKLATQMAQRNNQKYATTPKDLDMIQKILAKDKAPYQPSAQDVTRAAEKTKTQAELFKQYNDMTQGEPVTEVSPEYIERYKKEHGRRATAADQAGDYAKGHEHFKKINQLTKQQFQRGAKPEKVDEISNFMTQPTEPVSPEEQWKRRIRLLAKQYQTNASSLAALARENGPDSAEAVAYEYLRDPSKIRVPGATAPASAVNWDEVIRRLPMGLSGMALLQAAEEYLINNKGMLRSTVRSLLNNDENQRSLSAAYAKKNSATESVTEESDNEAVEQAIVRRIMVGRTDLLLKYGPKKVMQAVEEVADYVGAVDEIGSSDVSGWIRQVERVLG